MVPRPTDNAGFNGYWRKIVGQHQLDHQIGPTRHLNQRGNATTGLRQVHYHPVGLHRLRSGEGASELNFQSRCLASLHQSSSPVPITHRLQSVSALLLRLQNTSQEYTFLVHLCRTGHPFCEDFQRCLQWRGSSITRRTSCGRIKLDSHGIYNDTGGL